MDEVGCVNIFLAEGAGIDDIVADLEAAGRDRRSRPVRARQDRHHQPRPLLRRPLLRARSARRSRWCRSPATTPARPRPTRPTSRSSARWPSWPSRARCEGTPGVIGHDEERDDELRAIEFERIAGHKPFDPEQPWFTELLRGTGQA